MFKKLLKFLSVFFIFLFLLIIVIFAAYYLAYKDRVFPGVYYQEQHLGNWTRNEVYDFIEGKNKELLSGKLVLKYKDQEWSAHFADLNLMFKAEVIADKAYSLGRNGNHWQNFNKRFQLFWHSERIENSSEDLDLRYTAKYLNSLAQDINLEPIEGLFEFKEGKINMFKPSKDGRELDIERTLAEISAKMMFWPIILTIELPVKVLKPKTSMEKTDNLGVIELIGKGESFFKDSIPSRIHNIKLSAEKFHGILIKPNEIFSFNQNLGKVSILTGYQQAYVIDKGKTVLGDGGGICQTSTTLYRAALNAGLPIIERTPHSYRVSYYEPPVGMDATVFDPAPDLKIKNDTGKYILIQTLFDQEEQKLTFELYGTSDGRRVEISEPVIVSTSPAPPPIYQDDPNLPKGEEREIDKAHPGAKVYFKRKVTRNGIILIEEIIWSNYIPWSAVIIRGTKE